MYRNEMGLQTFNIIKRILCKVKKIYQIIHIYSRTCVTSQKYFYLVDGSTKLGNPSSVRCGSFMRFLENIPCNSHVRDRLFLKFSIAQSVQWYRAIFVT